LCGCYIIPKINKKKNEKYKL
jgi:hypothetical protein